jgi:multisubunit Na+/H+ antiporter MnhG subunit
MPAVTGLFVVVLLLALAAPLVLYMLVRSEHDQRVETDRETAEQMARRDTDDDRRVR